MKKTILLVLTLLCMLSLSACNNEKQEQTLYSFRGENEYFSVLNGAIVVNDTEEVFDGGDLEIRQPDLFEELASYSTTFYVFVNGERKTILISRVTAQTGISVNVDDNLGSISGEGTVFDNKVKHMDELKENLWFELKTTDLNGNENVYQIKLVVTE